MKDVLLHHRPVMSRDIPLICTFPQTAEELFHLHPKASFPLTPDQLTAAIELRADSTVVVGGGEVLGFANFYRWESGGACVIGNVVVAPQARRRGVGRYLINAMLDIAFSKHKAADVIVSCFSTNVGGLLFYYKLGFRPFALEERVDAEGRQVALIHMRLVHGVK